MNTSHSLAGFLKTFSSAAMTVLALCLPCCHARTIRVPVDFMTIQGAINSANPNDTILVSPGRFVENVNFNGRTLSLISRHAFTRDPRDIAATIIDGGFNGRSAIRLANGEGGLISGFTIVNDSTDFGGGIYCRLGNLTISHMIIRDCVASRNGGAIYITGGANVTVSDVVLQNNSCGNVGGAMSVYTGARALIERSIITGNYAAHVGGAIHSYGSRVQIRNCTIADNDALHNAGGLYLTQEGVVEVTNSILWNNEPHEVWVMAGFDATQFRPSFNIIEGDQQKVFVFAPINLSWGVGNFSADPLFADPENGDYSLREDSPCIDAGHYESAPDPDGTRSDLGAIPFDQGDGGQRVRIVPANYGTIQRGVDAAEDGDVVFVNPGTYRENVLIDEKQILMGSKILTTGDAAFIESTIIDGRDQSYGVAFRGDISNETVLKGFTIQNGRSDAGGGIVCGQGTAPRLENLLVMNNQAGRYGGGIYCEGNSSPRLKYVVVRNNRAVRGGGMNAVSSSPILEHCEFLNNTASERGGGFCGIGSTVTMRNVLVSDNHAGQDGGGGIFLWDCPDGGEIILDKSTITGNSVEGDGAFAFGGLSVQIEDRSFSIWATNNIIYGNGGREIGFFASQQEVRDRLNVSMDYNDLRNGREGITTSRATILGYGDGNFDADPQFSDPDNGDYHLAENSPCIDAGDPESDPDPDGTRADVGAFYFHQIIERQPATLLVPADYPTIQTAIDAAQQDDTVLVDPGRYVENINFNGKWITVGSRFLITNDPDFISQTIIDGRGTAETVRFGRQETDASKLVGFTITGGSGREGGGVFCLRANPTISYCVVTGNTAQDGGGGLYIYGSSPLLKNLTIVGNSAESGASAIHLRNSSYPTIINTIIYDNGPHAVVVSADRDPCTITINYSDVEGGQNAFELNDNGDLNWDEGNIATDPQFVDAEAGDYRLLSDSPCIDSGDPESPYDLDGSPADIGALGYFHAPEVEEFNIVLRRGWNLVGSPVIHPDSSMESIWRQQIESGDLILVKDMDGRFFAPQNNFNNIPGWVVWQGYAVRMERNVALTVQGLPVEEDFPIPLRRGWSMISYHPAEPVRIQDAFANVEDDIILVKDEMGRFYTPRYGFEPNITARRGEGYKVLARRAVELVWGRGRIAALPPSHYEDDLPAPNPKLQPIVTDRNMSILIRYTENPNAVSPTISAGSPASFARRGEATFLSPSLLGSGQANARWQTPSSAGTGQDLGSIELAAFTPAGLNVGYGVSRMVEGGAMIGLAVWGDDRTTVAVDGCKEGESLVVRGWREGAELTAVVTWVEGKGAYSTDGFAYGELTFEPGLPVSFALSKPYPNPFNSTVVISYDLPNASDVELVVTDLAGREQYRWGAERMAAGRHRLEWSGASLSAGVYFVTMRAGQFKQTEKLVLLR